MKKELKRRLIKLQKELDYALNCDSVEFGLLPALFSVLSFLWRCLDIPKIDCCKTYNS